jgi:shikimate dehydrogenase
MNKIKNLLENSNSLDLDQTDYYASIIGGSPSKGAKSPVLWNAAFNKLNLSVEMLPMDITFENLSMVIDSLRTDKRFIGGAVSVPFKSAIIPFMDKIEKEAEMIGAINCIYREGESLVGSNTDGAGALYALQNFFGKDDIKGKTILVLGIGGAGRAVATYVTGAVGKEGKVVLVNRTLGVCQELSEKLSEQCGIEVSSFPIKNKHLAEADIIINCSSVGFETVQNDEDGGYNLMPYTVLGPVDETVRINTGEDLLPRYLKKAMSAVCKNYNVSMKALSYVNRALIYDIIYQPQKTQLLHLAELWGFPTLNGFTMNLEQAVIAFSKTVNSHGLAQPSTCDVRTIMESVW